MIRKLAVCIAVLGLAAVAVAQAGGAATAPAVPAPPAVKVGIINIQAAIAFSYEGQRDFAALQKKFEPKQNEISTLNKEIEDLKKQLQAQANVGSDESRASLARSIEQKQKLLQRTAEDARSDYTAQQNEVAGKIGNKMLGVLDTYAKNNGFAVVLNYDEQNPQNPVLWAGASVDITRPVLEAYNIVSGVPAPPPPAPSAAKPATGTGTPAAAKPSASNPATPAPKPAGSNPPR
ncbi:MAG: OmpH family outer membrane protein [Terriglobales bacterium]